MSFDKLFHWIWLFRRFIRRSIVRAPEQIGTSQTARKIIKEIFDIVKNIFAAAFLKALARNSHSHVLSVIATIMGLLISFYAASYIYGYYFIVGADRIDDDGDVTWGGVVRVSLSLIVAYIVFGIISACALQMVEIIAQFQTK